MTDPWRYAVDEIDRFVDFSVEPMDTTHVADFCAGKGPIEFFFRSRVLRLGLLQGPTVNVSSYDALGASWVSGDEGKTVREHTLDSKVGPTDLKVEVHQANCFDRNFTISPLVDVVTCTTGFMGGAAYGDFFHSAYGVLNMGGMFVLVEYSSKLPEQVRNAHAQTAHTCTRTVVVVCPQR